MSNPQLPPLGNHFPAEVLDEVAGALGVGDRDHVVVDSGGFHHIELPNDFGSPSGQRPCQGALRGESFLSWLQENHMPPVHVQIKTIRGYPSGLCILLDIGVVLGCYVGVRLHPKVRSRAITRLPWGVHPTNMLGPN